MTIFATPLLSVSNALTDLATCLCAEITASDSPDVCFCGVVPGEAPSAMYAGDCSKKCGMAWVRLVSAYPATGVGVLSETPGNCEKGVGFNVELGMLRCTPIGEATTAPTPTQLLAAAELQYADLHTMRRAVACCSGSPDWSLAEYVPMGPAGGMVGGAWTVIMWVP